MCKVKVHKLNNGAVIPCYANPGDAGLDLFSIEQCLIPPHEYALVHTGISIELPENTEAQIRPRSGLAVNAGITVLNTPGTIDQGYRGEICVILINHGQRPFMVEKHMRIAQMVVAPIHYADMIESQDLSDSERGEKGFGSTGTNR